MSLRTQTSLTAKSQRQRQGQREPQTLYTQLLKMMPQDCSGPLYRAIEPVHPWLSDHQLVKSLSKCQRHCDSMSLDAGAAGTDLPEDLEDSQLAVLLHRQLNARQPRARARNFASMRAAGSKRCQHSRSSEVPGARA